jgi:hypothetical protein
MTSVDRTGKRDGRFALVTPTRSASSALWTAAASSIFLASSVGGLKAERVAEGMIRCKVSTNEKVVDVRVADAALLCVFEVFSAKPRGHVVVEEPLQLDEPLAPHVSGELHRHGHGAKALKQRGLPRGLDTK